MTPVHWFLFVIVAINLCVSVVYPYLNPPKIGNVKECKKEQKHDFQLVQLSSARRDQFLLDKNTGRVWNKVCAGKLVNNDTTCNGRLVWEQMIVLDLDDKIIK